MASWLDPNQKPVVRPVFFRELSTPSPKSSPFFEGRSPASCIEPVGGHGQRGGFEEEVAAEGVPDDGGGRWDGDPAEMGDEQGLPFEAIVPAEAFDEPVHERAVAEPADDSRVHEALASLAASVAELVGSRGKVLAGAEHDVVRLAVALARRIVAKELELRPELVLAAAREGLAVLSESERYVVRLAPGPSDAALEAFRRELVAKFGRAEILVDERLAPFSCVVESEHGRVDESIAARMESLLDQAGLARLVAER